MSSKILNGIHKLGITFLFTASFMMTFSVTSYAEESTATSNDQIVLIYTGAADNNEDNYAKVTALKSFYEEEGSYPVLIDAAEYEEPVNYTALSTLLTECGYSFFYAPSLNNGDEDIYKSYTFGNNKSIAIFSISGDINDDILSSTEKLSDSNYDFIVFVGDEDNIPDGIDCDVVIPTENANLDTIGITTITGNEIESFTMPAEIIMDEDETAETAVKEYLEEISVDDINDTTNLANPEDRVFTDETVDTSKDEVSESVTSDSPEDTVSEEEPSDSGDITEDDVIDALSRELENAVKSEKGFITDEDIDIIETFTNNFVKEIEDVVQNASYEDIAELEGALNDLGITPSSIESAIESIPEVFSEEELNNIANTISENISEEDINAVTELISENVSEEDINEIVNTISQYISEEDISNISNSISKTLSNADISDIEGLIFENFSKEDIIDISNIISENASPENIAIITAMLSDKIPVDNLRELSSLVLGEISNEINVDELVELTKNVKKSISKEDLDTLIKMIPADISNADIAEIAKKAPKDLSEADIMLILSNVPTDLPQTDVDKLREIVNVDAAEAEETVETVETKDSDNVETKVEDSGIIENSETETENYDVLEKTVTATKDSDTTNDTINEAAAEVEDSDTLEISEEYVSNSNESLSENDEFVAESDEIVAESMSDEDTSDDLIVETDTSGGTYTVQSGDCLWNIAQNHYGDGANWTAIYQANLNQISNPNLIYPGQVLILP